MADILLTMLCFKRDICQLLPSASSLVYLYDCLPSYSRCMLLAGPVSVFLHKASHWQEARSTCSALWMLSDNTYIVHSLVNYVMEMWFSSMYMYMCIVHMILICFTHPLFYSISSVATCARFGRLHALLPQLREKLCQKCEYIPC